MLRLTQTNHKDERNFNNQSTCVRGLGAPYSGKKRENKDPKQTHKVHAALVQYG